MTMIGIHTNGKKKGVRKKIKLSEKITTKKEEEKKSIFLLSSRGNSISLTYY
jgi:hypothetical protein